MTPEFLLNGRRTSLDGAAVQTTLLDYLRDQGLTGAKEGCAEGECGACTVVMLMDEAGGSAYRAVNSCLMFAPMAAGREIHTVESLAVKGELAEVQTAMAAAGGSQCGYCTPGFVMSMFAEQYRRDRTGPCDPHELGGNLCRCTGYRPIRDAALSLGPAPAGEFLAASVAACSAPGARRSSCRNIAILASGDAGGMFRDPGRRSGSASGRGRNRSWASNRICGAFDGSTSSASKASANCANSRRSADRVVIGAGLPLSEIPQRWPSRAGSVPRVAGPVRITRHPEPRDARRKSGDRLRDRRRCSAAAGARCIRAFGQRGRTARGSAAVLLHRIPPDRAGRLGN